MKHIKPGRGPSAMGGIGAAAAAVFGIFWTAIAPGFMKAFGVIFIVIAIAQELRVPVKFVGLGEGIDDMQPFDAKEYVGALI